MRPYLGYDIEWVQLGAQKPIISPCISAYYNFQITNRIGLRPEIGFIQKGVSFDQSDYERIIYKVKINYLEAPLTASVQFIKKEKFVSEVFVGGFGAIKLNSFKKVAYHNSEVSREKIESVNNFEAGVHYGLTFKYQIFEKLFLFEIRGINGLTDIFKVSENQPRLYYTTPETKIAGFNLTLGYEF